MLWFGLEEGPLWVGIDRSEPGWDWKVTDDDTPGSVMAFWRAAVARSREIVDEALAQGGLDQRGEYVTDRTGESPNLRRILIDLIEEYARHAGHADLIRESIDGVVGEDPPGYVPV